MLWSTIAQAIKQIRIIIFHLTIGWSKAIVYSSTLKLCHFFLVLTKLFKATVPVVFTDMCFIQANVSLVCQQSILKPLNEKSKHLKLHFKCVLWAQLTPALKRNKEKRCTIRYPRACNPLSAKTTSILLLLHFPDTKHSTAVRLSPK